MFAHIYVLQPIKVRNRARDRVFFGNEISPFFSIDGVRRLRMVVDYEESNVMFKDDVDVWHHMPVIKTGQLMIPL